MGGPGGHHAEEWGVGQWSPEAWGSMWHRVPTVGLSYSLGEARTYSRTLETMCVFQDTGAE